MNITLEPSGKTTSDQSEDESACAPRFDFHSPLQDMARHRWVRGWKPSVESWEIHTAPLTEKPECIVYEGSFEISVKMLWHGEFDIVESFPLDLVQAIGSDFAHIRELQRPVAGLPDESRSRVIAAVASVANRIRSGTEVQVETLLDSFRGRVEKLDQRLAHVKFVDQKGDISFAQIDADDLAKQGIREGDSFVCEIKARNGETAMTLIPLPKKQLGASDYAEIDKELDEALPDSLFDENKK